MAHPFRYPTKARVRRHGPAGYKNYRDYRPWLEDEFAFRCAYCLKRQRWAPTDCWSVDHLEPQSEAPDRECEYDNLVLTCQWCNSRKLARSLPDPIAVAYGNCLQVDDKTGEIRCLNDEGRILSRILKLNDPKQVQMRKDKIRILELLAKHSPSDWEQMMGYPESLPDLKLKSPPDGNSRLEGIADSYYERKKRGQLAKAYEE